VSDPRFRFQGDLAEKPLPEVLQTVAHYRVPGVLTVVHAGVEKNIYMMDGNVIFASSASLEDSLGSFLVRQGRLSIEQQRTAERTWLACKGTRRYGSVLVDLRLLSEAELLEVVTEQVKSILFSVFMLDEGMLTFQAGQFRADELIQLRLPTAHVILDGIKRLLEPRRVVARLGPSWSLFERTPGMPDPNEVPLTPRELRYLTLVDGQRTLRDLIGAGPGDMATNARLLYAFYVLKFITRSDLTPRSGIRKLRWRTGGGGGGAASSGA
jgi:Domain of unknown function (DUF4388)